MKKFALGCLGVLVLLAIAGGVAGYYAYNKAKSYVSSFAQLAEVPKIEAQVKNKAAFTAPENGVLTEASVTRFVAVQKTLKDRLGARVKSLDAKYETLNRSNGGNTSFSDGLSALKDLGSLILDAKKLQVEALDQQGFTLAEYDWTRKTVYQAAGIPLGADFEQIIRQAQAGTAPTQGSKTEAVVGDVPEVNKTLVAPYAESLKENVGLAFFGL